MPMSYNYTPQIMKKGQAQQSQGNRGQNHTHSTQNKFQNQTINSDQNNLQNTDSFHVQGIQPYQQMKKPPNQHMQLMGQSHLRSGNGQQFVEDNSDADSSGRNIDQEEQMMTEQDFDGQQEQEEEDDEGGHDHEQEQEQEDQDFSEQDGGQMNNDSYDEEQEDEDFEREEQKLNDNSQEGNIQMSSQSISPNGKIMLKLGVKNGEEDIQDDYGEEVVGDEKQSKHDESGSIRYSNIRSSGSPIMTSKSFIGQDILSVNEKKEVIVERNERFIIYKMVPQINRNDALKASKENMKALPKQQDQYLKSSQPTPVFHNRDMEWKNHYSETVEDNEASSFSSSEEKKESSNKPSFIGNGGKTQSGNDDCFMNEEQTIHNGVSMIKKGSNSINQLLISNTGKGNGNAKGKPPILKKSGYDNNQSDLQSNISRVVQMNRASSLKLSDRNQSEQEEKGNGEEDFDAHMGQKRKSLMQFSRSSSDRFNKLQKLEKKNIADDCLMESAELTLNQNFQSNQITNQTTNESKETLNQQQQIFQSADNQQQIYERRSSDSMILRSSMLKDSQLDDSNEQQQVNTNRIQQESVKRSQEMLKKEQNAEILKQEYLKLKRELNKMKKEPIQKDVINKNPKQQQTKPSQKQQVKPNINQAKQQQAKSKKNLVLDVIDHSPPQLNIQIVKDGEYLSNSASEESNGGDIISQIPQNRKSVTPSSIDKKHILKQKFMYQQKESAKAADGASKMSGLNQRFKNGGQTTKDNTKGNTTNKSLIGRDTSRVKASQRVSPNRDNIKSHRNILQNRQYNKQQKVVKTYDSESSEDKSHNDNSNQKIKKHKHHSKQAKEQSKVQNKRKSSKHHRRKHSSSESDHQTSSECSHDHSHSQCSHDDDSDDVSDNSCSYSDSQSFIEDATSLSSESDSDTKSRHLHQIKKTTGGNHYHMHYKSKKGQRQDRKFKIRANTSESNMSMLTQSRPDRIMIDLTVKLCKEGTHKKKCVCTGYQFLCIQVFYQVQEIASILNHYASTLTFFELINIYSDKKKLTLNCSKEQRSMQAIYNNQSQYVVCISQNIDCITPLAKYSLQSAASGYIMPQQAFQTNLNMNLPLNLMYQQQQQNLFQQQQQQPHQNQLLIQQQNQINAIQVQQQQLQQQQQQLSQNEQKHSMIFFSGLQQNQANQLALGKRDSQDNQVNDGITTTRQLPRNMSNNSLLTSNQPNLQQQQQLNQQFGTSTNHSPKLSFRAQQDNFLFNNKSPNREHSHSQNNHEQIIPQKNYLNHLKNRFLQTNQQEDSEPINSRNPMYSHHSGSVSTKDDQYRGEYQQKYNPTTMYNLSSQTSSYQKNEQQYRQNMQQQQQLEQSKKPHFRTNSLMVDYQTVNDKGFQGMGADYKQQNQRNTFKYCEEDEAAANLNNNVKTRYIDEQISKSPNFNNILQKQESRTQSPNNFDKDSCDNESMDEGVKASATRESALRSPKASTEFKSMLQKHSHNNMPNKQNSNNLSYGEHNYRSPQTNSNTKKLSNAYNKAADKSTPLIRNQDNDKLEQDKKGPQALYIGFNETSSANPFAKKPQLKARAQNISKNAEQDDNSASKATLVNRSKSVKNGTQQQKQSPPSIPVNTGKQMFVKQNKSPTNATSNEKDNKQQLAVQTKKDSKFNQFASSESPLKKAVADIKFKENVQRTSKVVELSINIVPTQSSKKPEKKLVNELDNDPSDPFHNKALVIEILDKKKAPAKGKQAPEISLADMFKSKKREIIEKLEHRKPQQEQDGLGQEEVETGKEDQGGKQERTKEQILEMRKQMMKSKVKVKQDHFGGGATPNAQNHQNQNAGVIDGGKGGKGSKDVPMDLMKRLAAGQKPQIDKKEMKNRTNKNYGNLPEVQKKKEEEKKREELAARKAAALEYAKQQEDKRRKQIQFKKKKSLAADDDK